MITAKYKGTNKSCGFETGKTYRIFTKVQTILRPQYMGRVCAEECLCVFDHDNKTHWCPYANLEAMLKNWEIIQEGG